MFGKSCAHWTQLVPPLFIQCPENIFLYLKSRKFCSRNPSPALPLHHHLYRRHRQPAPPKTTMISRRNIFRHYLMMSTSLASPNPAHLPPQPLLPLPTQQSPTFVPSYYGRATGLLILLTPDLISRKLSPGTPTVSNYSITNPSTSLPSLSTITR